MSTAPTNEMTVERAAQWVKRAEAAMARADMAQRTASRVLTAANAELLAAAKRLPATAMAHLTAEEQEIVADTVGRSCFGCDAPVGNTIDAVVKAEEDGWYIDNAGQMCPTCWTSN